MTHDGVAQLFLDANLRLVADGHRATVQAHGGEITLRTEDVGGFLASAFDSASVLPDAAEPLHRRLGRIAELLAEEGLSARIVGPSGTVLAIGHDCASAVGRTVLRSDQIRFGTAPALARTMVGYLRASASIRHRILYASAGGAAVLLAASGFRGHAQRTTR